MQTSEKNESWLSEINVTTFVDILLVLLIIFMVTAPIMTRSVGVNLPKEKLVKAGSQEKLDFNKILILGLTNKGQVIYQKKKFKLSHFFESFRDLTRKLDIRKVFIQADKSVSYEYLLHLMVFLNNQGHGNIGLVFDKK